MFVDALVYSSRREPNAQYRQKDSEIRIMGHIHLLSCTSSVEQLTGHGYCTHQSEGVLSLKPFVLLPNFDPTLFFLDL